MAKQEVRKLVVKSALRVLPLAELQADPSYQREVKAKHATIIKDFNEEALGIPLVGEREDRGLWIVDGLQRITALRKMGRTTVRAEVFASRGPEHEAEVFKLVNMNRTKLTAGEQFRALLTAGDDLAWEVKNAVEAEGYKLTLGGGRGNATEGSPRLTCVSTLLQICRDWGAKPITFALGAAKECWPGDALGVYNAMVGGLASFYNRNDGVVDLDRLYPRLRTVTPQKVLYAANQTRLANNLNSAVADQIEKVYRKRLGRPKGS